MIGDKQVINVSVEDIIPNRFQPRIAFDEKSLNELADSIREHGIIQPLLLRRIGDKYEVIAGERRYKAAGIVGLNNVPAIIVETDDNESAEIAIIENIQRKDLTAIEEAQSYKKLLDKGNTQDQVAKKLGIAQSTIANKLRLLALPEEAQEALLYNRISERHARSLLRLTNAEQQINLMNKIIQEKLNVRQTEDEIDSLLNVSLNNDFIFNNIEISPEPTKEESQKEEIFEAIPDILTPFSEIEMPEIEIPQTIEQSEEIYPIEEIKVLDQTEENNVISKDINIVKNETQNLVDSLKARGYEIDTEEYDFDGLYQIVIKVKKDS